MQQGSGKLIVCPTPLGNLGDISERVLASLREADVVCSEDTRVTGKLLASFDIKKPLERLDEAVLGDRAEAVIQRIADGEVIAYCTDAGMPGVSDPGLRLVRAARKANVVVEVLPGPTAATTAYVASGCPNSHFFFGGFLPRKQSDIRRVLTEVSALDAALIFYESPNRLVSSLEVIAQVFPYRVATVCRELTKLHEEIVRGTTPELQELFAARAEEQGIKGEIVIVIDGPTDAEGQASHEALVQAASARIADLCAEGVRKKEIAQRIAEEFGLARNEAYDLVLNR